MPDIKHRDLEAIVVAVDALQRGIVIPQPEASPGSVTRWPALKLPPMTGVKLSRIRRVINPAYDDYIAQKDELLKRHAAKILEDGTPELDPNGQVIFETKEIEEECRKEIAELMEGTVAISESLTTADFRRKERDDAGKVTEVDEIEPWIIDALVDLIITKEEPAPTA